MISTTPTLVHHFLEHSAQQYPDKVALTHAGVRSTYAEINAQANQLAQLLLDCGVTYNQRVVLLLENSLEYVVAYYGALKAGAVVVPLSSDSKPDGLQGALLDVEPSVIVSCTRIVADLTPKPPPNRTTWPALSTPPALPAVPKASCCRTGTSWPTLAPFASTCS